jgi:hypothetical protein
MDFILLDTIFCLQADIIRKVRISFGARLSLGKVSLRETHFDRNKVSLNIIT